MKLIIAQGHHHHGSWYKSSASSDKVHELVVVSASKEFVNYPQADAFIDLDFNGTFYASPQKPILINEPIKKITQLTNAPALVGRFCGWPGFCERPVWEVAVHSDYADWVTPIMQVIGKQYELVTDEPGLVAPRLISMIINEAFYGLAENIASPANIDLAMKLGTNYPNGPIAWADRIGRNNIHELLIALSKQSDRYLPHPFLKT